MIQNLTASPTPVQAGLLELIDKAKDLSIKARDAAKKEITEHIDSVAKDLKVTRDKIQLAFDEPHPRNMLKACGYSIATMHGCFAAASRIADNGVMASLIHIAGHKTMHKIGHKIKDKAKDADDIIKKYPALKALTGPAIAGLMLYGYTTANTRSLGDWDLTNVGKALKGEISVHDFVQSDEAHALGTHISTGHGMSLAALAGSSVTLALGLVATAVNNSDHPKVKELGAAIKDRMAKILPTKKLSDLAEAPKENKGKPSESPEKPKEDKPKEEKPDLTKEKPKNPGWWQRMSDNSKDGYLQKHPESNMASIIPGLVARAHNEI